MIVTCHDRSSPLQRPPSLERTITSVTGLRAAGLLPPEAGAQIDAVAARYAIAITPLMAELIDRNDAHDPIARQLVPALEELQASPHELLDPIGDEAHAPVPGIVHRYADRLLLKVTQLCPVYCRFCFRRETVGPGGEAALTGPALERAIGYIAEHPEVFEVILTGGDPLMLSARRLGEIAQAIAVIPHVRVLRIHSRVPVMAPNRINQALVDALLSAGKATYLAVHVNHAREFTALAQAAIAKLRSSGITLLSQSVLLKGVNDTVAALDELFRACLASGIKPYYLHHMDLAPGTQHFRTSLAHGHALMRALEERLSGLARPTYMLEIPGGFGKVRVEADTVRVDPATGSTTLIDAKGRAHDYPDLACGSPQQWHLP